MWHRVASGHLGGDDFSDDEFSKMVGAYAEVPIQQSCLKDV